MSRRATRPIDPRPPHSAGTRWRLPCCALVLLQACGSGGGKGSTTEDGASGAGGSGSLLSGPNGSAGSSSPPASGEGPHIAGCAVFPADNAWNRDVSSLPLRANSDVIIDAIGRADHVHPDFGTEWEGAPIGIPFVTVSGTQARVPITFTAYGDESDPGPYPVPRDAPVEGGAEGDGDRHVLVVDTDACTLYELCRAFPGAGGAWSADSGAVFELSRNDEHPLTWTSADAAGLPIFPGLVRYDEVVTEGALRHAVRFTVSRSRRAIVAPARHHAGSSDASELPPMGLRLRMKQSYDCSSFSPPAQVVCAGLKRYGLIVADNGSDWYLSGAPDARWDDDAIGDLKAVTGNAFEVVDTGPIETY